MAAITQSLCNQVANHYEKWLNCIHLPKVTLLVVGGTVLAWGSNNLAQLGRPPVEDARGVEGKLVLLKSSRRVVRLPHAAHSALDTPSQVPNIPTPVISYRSYDVTPLAGLVQPLSVVEKSLGETTLHYILERLNGLYDSAKIMDKVNSHTDRNSIKEFKIYTFLQCIQLGNWQAASKISLLERNFTDALSYQLKMLNTLDLKIHKVSSTCDRNDSFDTVVDETPPMSDEQNHQIKENTKLFDRHMEKNLVDTLEESEERYKMKMSASRSLDSFESVEQQELHTFDCQGGSEELCEDSKSDDISLDITEDALDSVDEEQMRNNGKRMVQDSLSKLVNLSRLKESDNETGNTDVLTQIESSAEKNLDLTNRNIVPVVTEAKGNQENTVVNEATSIVEFYVNEIEDESHAMMREVLQIAIEFWIKHNLPIENLENVLLRHMSKFFYPLGLLLFWQVICNSFGGDRNEE